MDIADLPTPPHPERRVRRTGLERTVDNSLASLRKQLDAMDPFKAVRRNLLPYSAFDQLVSDQQKAFERATAGLKDVFAVDNLFKHQVDQFAASIAASHALGLRAEFDSATRAISESFLKPSSDLSRMLDMMKVPQKDFAATFAREFRAADLLARSFDDTYKNPLKGLATDALFTKLIDRLDLLSKESTSPLENLTPARMQEVSANLQEAVQSAAYQPTLGDALHAILGAIREIKDTTAQRVLYFLLLPLLLLVAAAVINPIANHYIKRFLTDSPQGDKKGVHDRAQLAVGDPSALTHYRYVAAKVLTVRAGPRAKALAVGVLRFGQAVLVLEHRGAFTQVLWTSSDGESQVKGWVFSRHLHKFR